MNVTKLIAKANSIASERDEKAAESMMMAEAHRNAGRDDIADGWDLAASHAIETAMVLRQMAALIAPTPTPDGQETE